MQRVDVNELNSSMVIAATIKDDCGNIIFMKGTALTEKHIVILKNRGVQKVSVEGHSIVRVPGTTENMEKKIDERFSTAGSHPAAMKIRDIIKELLS